MVIDAESKYMYVVSVTSWPSINSNEPWCALIQQCMFDMAVSTWLRRFWKFTRTTVLVSRFSSLTPVERSVDPDNGS